MRPLAPHRGPGLELSDFPGQKENALVGVVTVVKWVDEGVAITIKTGQSLQRIFLCDSSHAPDSLPTDCVGRVLQPKDALECEFKDKVLS
jgi:hypothetical protein